MKRRALWKSATVDGESSSVERFSDALGTTELAINHYRVPSDARLPSGLHAHEDQEEVFVVLSGTAMFETLAGEVAVSEGEAIRFAPGEFQAGRNDGDDPLELLALGAPMTSEDVRIPVGCPTCGHDDLRLDVGDEAFTFVCPDCGVEREPVACPSCSGDDLRVTLGDDDDPVTVCRDCAETFDRPPIRGEW